MCLAATATVAQPPAKPEPKLTKALGDQIIAGKGKMTEAEAIRLLPGPYSARVGSGNEDADTVLTWSEEIEIKLVVRNKKVYSSASKFDPTVESDKLTLAAFKTVKQGTPQADVVKLFGEPNYTGPVVKVGADKSITQDTWKWRQGRELLVYIKDGKVVGGGYLSFK
jgi:hypothetical protein